VRLFLNSSVIVYLLEGQAAARATVQQRITDAQTAQHGLVLVSRLASLECRTLPLRNNDSAMLTLYDGFFAAQGLEIREIDATVVDKATELRANLGLRTPDAIHVATALIAGATLFLTGDKQLQRRSAVVPVEIVSP
jgi:predicted nucleic acid-binding protein